MTAVPAHYCTIPTAPASPAARGSPPCPRGSPSPITTFKSCDRGKCLCEHRRREEHEAMPDESPRASIDLDLVTKIVAAFVWRNQVTRSTRERYRDRLSRAWATWQTSGRTGRRAETSGSCSEIRDQGSRNLSDLRMARGNAASAPLDRPRSQPLRWLMNRQPALWRDRQEVNMTGSLEHRLSQMTPEERIRDAHELAERARRRIAGYRMTIEHHGEPEPAPESPAEPESQD